MATFTTFHLGGRRFLWVAALSSFGNGTPFTLSFKWAALHLFLGWWCSPLFVLSSQKSTRNCKHKARPCLCVVALRLFLRLWQLCLSWSDEGSHHQRKKKARATTHTVETIGTTTNNNEGQSAPQGKGSLPTTQKARGCASFTLAFAWRPSVSSLWERTFPLSLGWRLSLSSLGWRPPVSSFGNRLLFPLQKGDLPCRPCQKVPGSWQRQPFYDWFN